MSHHTFRVRNKGGERGLGVKALYGKVGWDKELATLYFRCLTTCEFLALQG